MAKEAKFEVTANLLLNPKGIAGLAPKLRKPLSEVTQSWMKEVESDFVDAMVSAIDTAVHDGKTEKAWEDFVASPVIAFRNQILKSIEKGDTAQAHLIHERLKQEVRAQAALNDARKSALDELHKRQLRNTSEHIDELRSGFQTVGQNLLGGDVASLLDLLKTGGSKLQERGLAKQQEAKEVGVKSPELAAKLGGMGKQLAALGSSIAVFAAVAGSIVVLIKLFIDLESKAKEMNKAIIEGAGAADFGFSAAEISGGALASTLKDIRDETTAVNDNFLKFRASAKEQQDILAQFGQAGLTLGRLSKEIEKGNEHMESFSDATAVALTYAKNLGISASEAAQQMGQFTMDTGMGLRDIAEQFSVVTREAMQAGLSTKRFYQAVSESASNMAFYGLRIEETTRLLSTFDSLLGETVGTDAFKQLVGRYQDKGMQDRLRELIVKDQEFSFDQFDKAYKRTLQGIVRDFGEEIKTKGLNVEDILRKASSEVDLRKQLADLGFQGAKQQQFLAAFRLQKAVEGGPGATAAGLAAMPYAGPSFDIALALKSALPLEDFGKSLGEVYETATRTNNKALLVALEQLSETSGKSLDQLIALDNQGRATFERLAEVRDGVVTTMPEDLKKMGFFIDDQTQEIRRGFYDAAGNLVRMNAVAVKDSFDVLASTPTEGEDTMLEALTRDQQIATEIARNTSGVSDVLEQTVASILNNIYDVVSVIADFLADDSAKQQKLAAQQNAKTRRDALAAQAKAAEQTVTDLSKQFEMATQQGDKDLARQLQTELEVAKQNATLAEQALTRQEAISNAITALDENMLKAEGAGAKAVLDAIERQGEKVFDESLTKDDFIAALDAALPRYQESTKEGWDYFAEEFSKNASATLGNSIDDWAEDTKKKLLESPIAGRIAGGEAAIDAAIQKGIEAAQERKGWSILPDTETSRAMGEAFSTAVSTAIAEKVVGPGSQRAQDATLSQLQELVRLAKEQSSISAFDVASAILSNARRAQDVIIPSRGAPVITDSRDTIVASKPGGPLSQAGSRSATFNITINGNDPQKIYKIVIDTLQKAGMGRPQV